VIHLHDAKSKDAANANLVCQWHLEVPYDWEWNKENEYIKRDIQPSNDGKCSDQIAALSTGQSWVPECGYWATDGETDDKC
jgi:hypothetical protein